MTSVTESDIVDKVQQLLAKQPNGDTFTVVAKSVHAENDWWFVPVLPKHELADNDAYYKLFANVEEVLHERDNLNVTLVPTSNILKLVPQQSMLRSIHVDLSDWETLCKAAGLNALLPQYDSAQCSRIADAIKSNPSVIRFEPPSYSKEAEYFFRQCDGITIK